LRYMRKFNQNTGLDSMLFNAVVRGDRD